jgi:hypothetical protein
MIWTLREFNGPDRIGEELAIKKGHNPEQIVCRLRKAKAQRIAGVLLAHGSGSVAVELRVVASFARCILDLLYSGENVILTTLINGEAFILYCTKNRISTKLSMDFDHHIIHPTQPVIVIEREQLRF